MMSQTSRKAKRVSIALECIIADSWRCDEKVLLVPDIDLRFVHRNLAVTFRGAKSERSTQCICPNQRNKSPRKVVFVFFESDGAENSHVDDSTLLSEFKDCLCIKKVQLLPMMQSLSRNADEAFVFNDDLIPTGLLITSNDCDLTPRDQCLNLGATDRSPHAAWTTIWRYSKDASASDPVTVVRIASFRLDMPQVNGNAHVWHHQEAYIDAMDHITECLRDKQMKITRSLSTTTDDATTFTTINESLADDLRRKIAHYESMLEKLQAPPSIGVVHHSRTPSDTTTAPEAAHEMDADDETFLFAKTLWATFRNRVVNNMFKIELCPTPSHIMLLSIEGHRFVPFKYLTLANEPEKKEIDIPSFIIGNCNGESLADVDFKEVNALLLNNSFMKQTAYLQLLNDLKSLSPLNDGTPATTNLSTTSGICIQEYYASLRMIAQVKYPSVARIIAP
eukprot:GHVH01016960.1.p1 GENE.GHVH01016960.1~~GHVH01016960.1.p1  ORF type:complete len:450 (+),score=65.06 GHVH01016960.1:83-1432(+)